MVDLRGTEELRALSKALRQAKDRDLQAALGKALNTAAKPIKDDARQSALTTLPSGGGSGRRKTRLVKTGGTLTNAVSGKTHAVKRKVATKGYRSESLAERVAGATYSVRSRGGRNPAVTIVARTSGRRKVDLRALDDGTVRHPLFGKRRYWYAQRVTPGWFSKAVEKNLDGVREEIVKAVDEVAAKLTGRG